ncbi:V-type ATP synthase subunit I [Bacteroides graminisolvens]|uniref:V-type ATP synthase subunit I n=1 Tax=Bacteroides graminisolvens TaxID=477666 RepID=UPI0023F38353|nr:V-type ATPase 116kDa subunit family protein [Bacteroides graminisolvens]MDD3211587.1 V-type ATPase 116kDa subunit family protein [Bacteroides graminisolvens]MDD4417602.1 V-type ATPase 116kDa subunit family protein [Bacteroides graminisolvens]
MITKMKKLTFLVYHKEYDAFLNNLRDLGVVHIAEKQQGMADNSALQEKIRLSARLSATIKLLQNIKTEEKVTDDSETVSASKGMQILDEVDELLNHKSSLQQQILAYEKELAVLEPWGDFSPESIAKLHDSGYDIGFYISTEANFNEDWIEAYNAMVINRVASKVYFITFTKTNQEIDLDVERIKLPDRSYGQTQELILNNKEELLRQEETLQNIARKDIPSLLAARKELNGEIEFDQVVLNTEPAAGEKLMLLQGWLPASEEDPIVAYLNSQSVYYDIKKPAPEDNVPIQLNNKGLFAWFEPICKLYMLPKYNELDLTPFFAPFFMLFFGLCLGDSGYGLFLLLGVTLYRLLAKNIGQTMKPILSLVQLLAASTFFCGMLTGTFFGANFYDLDWPFIQRMKQAIAMDNNDMFQLSLLLGVIQILFGMILKAVNQAIQFGFKYAVGTIGWIILLVSIGLAAVLPAVFPMGGTAHLVILAIAGAMILFYNSPDKNIFINFGLGLWDSYNMVTGLLGDILSYVRLFALGLSGGILASVFNSLAVGMSPDNVIAGPIVMVLIFVIGHSINIFMNVLGAMVHPMRLTFVEFFKNSGYEGGGKEYKPFSK